MTKMIDRKEASRLLAKAIAYKQCGRDQKGAEYAALLVVLLESESILSVDGVRRAGHARDEETLDDFNYVGSRHHY